MEPKKAKIVHLTSVHPTFDTRIFYKECRTLADMGYEVVLIVPHNKDEQVDGVKIRAVPKAKYRLVRMTYTTWRVFRASLRESAQLFHIHDPELLPWAYILSLLNKRVIYDMHENVPKAILTKPWIKPFLRHFLALFYSLIERFFLKKMPIIFAERSYLTDYQWSKKAIVVLNMPLSGELLSLKEQKYPTTTLGYIGDVTPERGILVILGALSILKQQGYFVNWECIGPIDNRIHELRDNIPEGVNARGYMQPSEGYRIIARCHIGLAILQPIPNYTESYPTKMFEYMALGLPVIASNFPLYREIIEKEQCGICVDPEDPQGVAEALKWLIEHPWEATEMGRRGREAVCMRYNWATEARKLDVFYRELLRIQ